MKKTSRKTSGKCPECKGTGEATKKHKDSPDSKCMECDGTGEAQRFQMIFWGYDLFPFILGSRGFLRDDGLAFCPSYNACFRPLKVMSLEDGKKFKAALDELEKEHKVVTEALQKSYRMRVQQIAPWAIKNKC